ncbi:MAG: immunoglobulin domain-containing protein [Armatimonadota bacterium]
MTRKTALLATIPLLVAMIGCGGKLDELVKPIIANQPSNQTVKTGNAFGFAVLATGAGLNYQWFKLNTTTSTYEPITGGTSPTYSKTVSVAGDIGTYRVEVSNAGGTTTSNAVTLTLTP